MRSSVSIYLFLSAAIALQAPAFSQNAVIADNFTDPSLIQEPNGQYWAFSSSNSVLNVPIAKSQDFSTWELQPDDALPSAGAWTAKKPDVKGPDVNLLNSGKYIMYYSAALARNSSIHCIGVAVSSNVRGPYIPNSEPWYCPEDDGGASDPSAFQDPADDSLYVLSKIDGNALVAGGLCGNESPNQAARSTPIMIQKVDNVDGQTRRGQPSIILQRGADECPTLGAPSLTAVYNAQGTNSYAYFLFYSSGCYNSVKYATRYATSLSGPTGSYNKAATPLMRSGDGKNLHSPASLDISGDAEHVLFSSYEHVFVKGRRQLHTGLVQINGLVATI